MTAVAISPDGSKIASGGMDKSLRQWAADTGRELAALYGHEGSVYWLSFSRDSRKVASFSIGEGIRVWDAAADPDRWLSWVVLAGLDRLRRFMQDP